MDEPSDPKLSLKERARQARRAAYERAKAFRAADPRQLAMKEALKQRRRDANRAARDQRQQTARDAKAAARDAKATAAKETLRSGRALVRSDAEPANAAARLTLVPRE